MNVDLRLKAFSQDVELSDIKTVKYNMVFTAPDGREGRFPVPKETVDALMLFLYAGAQAVAAQPAPAQPAPQYTPEAEAEEFGGDYEEEAEEDDGLSEADLMEQYASLPAGPPRPPVRQAAPAPRRPLTEEGVPSL